MKRFVLISILSSLMFSCNGLAQEKEILSKLEGFDQYMEKLLSDWNAPGIGVGIVYKDKLVFQKGYGYRDYDKKLKITENTLYQIASNTKLFTATAAGFLVEEGKLEWDKTVRTFIPGICFYNDALNNSVTLRDMLAHRTGISRHDLIWYKSDFTRKQLFEKLKYLEPSRQLREGFLYNNLMYCAAGYIIEIISGKTWEEYLKEKILEPLEMTSTVFSIDEMLKHPDYFVPYNEKRDTTLLYRIPYYADQSAVGPAGAVISNISDMSKWLIAQMNGGRYNGKQVIPEKIIQETLTPAIIENNKVSLDKGYFELLSPTYGMGRDIASYRGHLITYHGGSLNGIHSQISFMPADSIGVIVFTIGDHTRPLYNTVTFNVYERLLGMDETPWSGRNLGDRIKGLAAYKEGRQRVGTDKVPGTNPSHPIEDYPGIFENPAYGKINITNTNQQLQFDFHGIKLPLSHYHYDRFDSPDDEETGKWSFNFLTNPQGEISKLEISLDEEAVIFTRQPDESLKVPQYLAKFIGKYVFGGAVCEIILREDKIVLVFEGQPDYDLIPVKKEKFQFNQFPDLTMNFILDNDVVKAFDLSGPSGVYRYEKKKE